MKKWNYLLFTWHHSCRSTCVTLGRTTFPKIPSLIVFCLGLPVRGTWRLGRWKGSRGHCLGEYVRVRLGRFIRQNSTPDLSVGSHFVTSLQQLDVAASPISQRTPHFPSSASGWSPIFWLQPSLPPVTLHIHINPNFYIKPLILGAGVVSAFLAKPQKIQEYVYCRLLNHKTLF